ncbi:hypothetical protein EV424DRAFT_1543297 [Suillus variegatus]|nr:hypothetical protein EV424DRAFT_1543297 [Suillus variegatus]
MTQDPYTNTQVAGVLLKLSKYRQHQEDEQILRSKEDEVRHWSIETTFMAKSLKFRTEELGDPTITTRDSDTMPSQAQTISSSPEDSRTRAEQVDSEEEEYSTSLLLLTIVFEREPTSAHEPPCALKWKESSLFMIHHNTTEKFIEMVDTIQSKGDYMVHQTQKDLVAELQAYLVQLDQLVVDRWERRKLERGLLACGIPQVEMENMNLKFIQKTPHHFETREKLKIVIPPFLACITTAIILHELSNLSREHTNFLLSALRVIVVSSCCYIMQTCGAKYNRHSIRAKVLEILEVDKWPNDIWTASQAIGLEPDLQIYACCIRCHSPRNDREPTVRCTSHRSVTGGWHPRSSQDIQLPIHEGLAWLYTIVPWNREGYGRDYVAKTAGNLFHAYETSGLQGPSKMFGTPKCFVHSRALMVNPGSMHLQFRQNPGTELRVPRVYPGSVLDLADVLANGVPKPPLLAKEVMEQHDSSNEHKDVLQNFISLVIAVHWASQRSSCLDHIDVVQSQFDYYLKSLVRLFGKGVLIPNHHLLLHLVECLHAFGLVHRWWSFPLEQYNGIIQRKNTNNKLGQLELTFTRSFCRSRNLKALLSLKGLLPEMLEELQDIVGEHYGTDFHRGFAE